MENREENLKKINAELEQLSDEELENVAGGNISETVEDSRILFDHRLMEDSLGPLNVFLDWVNESRLVDEGWSKAGITCVTKFAKSNQYFVDGKEVSRDEAIKIMKSKIPQVRW